MELYREFTLSKKLKRRIQELCGFNDLSREERLNRAHEILNSSELKQSICHQILGTTFKDIERAMDSILKERQLTPAQEEELELRESHPEKFESDFYPEVEFKVNKHAADTKKTGGLRPYTREEVAELLAASNAPYQAPAPLPRKEYPTLTREQVQELMRHHWEYIENEKKRKQEREHWDSQKTTAFAAKTASTTKRTNSSKG